MVYTRIKQKRLQQILFNCNIRMCRNYCLLITVLSLAGLYLIYTIVLKAPPPAEVLAANRGQLHLPPEHHLHDDKVEKNDLDWLDDDRPKIVNHSAKRRKSVSKVNSYYGDRDIAGSKSAARKAWNQFILANNFVDVGFVLQTCTDEPKDEMVVGKVILLQDLKNGGLKTRTFLNFTVDKRITSGGVFVESFYNDHKLYDNHWDLCTGEEQEDKIIFCPVAPGPKAYVKDVHIPSYLPKGRYRSKAWITNQYGEKLGCSYSQFTL